MTIQQQIDSIINTIKTFMVACGLLLFMFVLLGAVYIVGELFAGRVTP